MTSLTKRPTHDALLPYLNTTTTTGAHIARQIQEQGYCVLPHILTPSECTAQLSLLWEFVQATAPGVRRDDPNTWYPPPHTDPADVEHADPWPHSGWKFLPDMCQSFQAGWLFSGLRELLAERVFGPLYNTTQLHSSKEGFTFHRPTAPVAPNGSTHPVLVQERPRVCGKVQHRGNGEHFDQCASDTGLHCIQSSTALLDQHEGDGCFMCWPKSHRQHATMTKDIWRGRSDWVPLTDEELDTLKALGMCPIRVPVNAGDVILWRSDLAHCGAGPSCPTTGFRAVSYTCMLPAAMTPPNVLDGKLEEYLTMQTGDHRPNVKSRHFAKPKQKGNGKKGGGAQGGTQGKKGAQEKKKDKSGGRGIKVARGQYFSDGPPRLTRRQAELYGLVQYNNEQETKEGQVPPPMRKGVRLVEEPVPSTLSPNMSGLSGKKSLPPLQSVPPVVSLSSGNSLPPIGAMPIRTVPLPQSRSVDKQAEIEKDMDALFAQLGVKRGQALEEALKPVLKVPVPFGGSARLAAAAEEKKRGGKEY